MPQKKSLRTRRQSWPIVCDSPHFVDDRHIVCDSPHFADVRHIVGKTGVTADRDKIEFRLFNSSSIFNITLREELFSLPKQN